MHPLKGLNLQSPCRGQVFDFSTLVAEGMAEGAVKIAATPPPRSPTAGGRRKVKAGRRAAKTPPQAADSPFQEDVLGIVEQGTDPHDWHPKWSPVTLQSSCTRGENGDPGT